MNAPGTAAGTGGDTLERITAATVACIARSGLTKTTIDDIARESGCSRATLYRAVPGGRDALVATVLVRETERFFLDLEAAMDGVEGLEEKLVVGLAAALRLLRDHGALRAVAAREPHLLLPQFAFQDIDGVFERVARFVRPHIEGHLDPTVELVEIVEFLVRIVLSHTLHPSPFVDPDEPDTLRRLVRLHILPGIVGQPLGATP